jgi:hypothetical protein
MNFTHREKIATPLLWRCIAYTIKWTMFEWDRNNFHKIRAHHIKHEEAEQALLNDPIPVYEQEVEGEIRFA